MMQRSQLLVVRRRRMLDGLVTRIVELSAPAVCALVADRLVGMTLCEARGYIRARSGREIRRQVRLAFSQQSGINAAWEPLVVLRAAEKVTPAVLRQLSAARGQHAQTSSRAA
jgi:hypothetical protein